MSRFKAFLRNPFLYVYVWLVIKRMKAQDIIDKYGKEGD